MEIRMPSRTRVQLSRLRAPLPLAFLVLLAACRRESEPFAAQLRVESVSPAPTPAASQPPRRTDIPERSKYVPKPGDFSVVCTLFSGPPPGARVTLPAIPITYDAHIIVGARVEAVTLGTSPWPPGTALRFLIHSPRPHARRLQLLRSALRPHFFAFPADHERRSGVVRSGHAVPTALARGRPRVARSNSSEGNRYAPVSP